MKPFTLNPVCLVVAFAVAAIVNNLASAQTEGSSTAVKPAVNTVVEVPTSSGQQPVVCSVGYVVRNHKTHHPFGIWSDDFNLDFKIGDRLSQLVPAGFCDPTIDQKNLQPVPHSQIDRGSLQGNAKAFGVILIRSA